MGISEPKMKHLNLMVADGEISEGEALAELAGDV